jgi:hypothetical protein
MLAPSTYVPALWASGLYRQVVASGSVHLRVVAAGYIPEHIYLHKVVLADFAGVSRQLICYSYHIHMDSFPFFSSFLCPGEVSFPYSMSIAFIH